MRSPVTPEHPIALLESFSRTPFSRSFRFEGVDAVIAAYSPDEVAAALEQVEQAVATGRHAAGFVSYEAAAAINPELPVMEPTDLPLVWFGIFRERLECSAGADESGSDDCRVSTPELAIDRSTYLGVVDAIRELIAGGESYQVNFTTRQRFTLTGDPFSLYRRICRNQQAPFCAWLDIGTHRILSASPELFFSLDNSRITMKPMKGTAPRMPQSGDDLRQMNLLSQSAKDRAENLMIVDLVRNDLATIAETGSVSVTSLFDVETYPTVHQMTSTVTARIGPEVGLSAIFRALFPCGSVTGAPKRRTMEIIKRLEGVQRGLYCGAIGYMSPGREAVFSVAIRTAVMEAATGQTEIGIGSGITWDSDPESEFLECLTKSAFIDRDSRPFRLIETVRFDREGYLLLEEHLDRLAGSAVYFGFSFDTPALRERLDQLSQGLSGIMKIRILLAQDGAVTVETQPLNLPAIDAPPPLIAISQKTVISSDPFLYHKTTRRTLYESELRAHPDCYDVVFLNERKELTEGSFNTVVVSMRGELLTPAVDCGVLPGVLRGELIKVGAIRETILTADDLQVADTVWLVNSVRGWRECMLSGATDTQGDLSTLRIPETSNKV